MSTRLVRKVPHARVGCAGWSIPVAKRDAFGQGDSVLSRYATVFDAVEINSSFYRPHQRRTYERWAASVPASFRFSAKVPKNISHVARLRGTAGLLDRFIAEVTGLGDRLSVLLLQLPPSLDFHARDAGAFLRTLRERWTGGCVCEPRHSSWFTAQARDSLAEFDVGMVAADPPPCDEARVPAEGPFRYWRLHGSPKMYYSAYSQDELSRLAGQVSRVSMAESPWVIFDNTAAGHAIPDALALLELLAAQTE